MRKIAVFWATLAVIGCVALAQNAFAGQLSIGYLMDQDATKTRVVVGVTDLRAHPEDVLNLYGLIVPIINEAVSQLKEKGFVENPMGYLNAFQHGQVSQGITHLYNLAIMKSTETEEGGMKACLSKVGNENRRECEPINADNYEKVIRGLISKIGQQGV